MAVLAVPYPARVAGPCYRGRLTTPQSESFPHFGRRCTRSNLGSLSPSKCTSTPTHPKGDLAYLCGFLLRRLVLLALLSPTRFGSFAGRFGPLFGRHVLGACLAALGPSELP